VGQAVPVLLQGCRDRAPAVRQSSVYGLGVLAEHRPEHFRPIAGEAVARMLEMITAPGSRRGGRPGPDCSVSGVRRARVATCAVSASAVRAQAWCAR